MQKKIDIKKNNAKHEHAVRVTDPAKEYGMAKSTISTMIENKEAVRTTDVAKCLQRPQIMEGGGKKKQPQF